MPRELLETQPDIAIVGGWIAEVEQQRKSLERQLGNRPTAHTMSQLQIRALVSQLRYLTQALASASVEDRRAVYDELGVSLTYHPESKTVEAGAGAPHVLRVGVGGAYATLNPHPTQSDWIKLTAA